MADFLRRIITAGNRTGGRETADVADQLVQLDERVRRRRVELDELDRELGAARQLMTAGGGPMLREVNQNLVIAALRAEATAEVAVINLDELSRTSQRDPLTGTANRATLLDRLESGIALARRHGTRIAVLFFDLDGFKQINDSLGHAAGDQVLQMVAHRLESGVRDSDTVSRYGGDEFVVLLTEVTDSAAAASVAAKLVRSLAAPGIVEQTGGGISASFGIALHPDDGDEAAALIELADAAMYRAKRRARGAPALPAEGIAGPKREPSLAAVTTSPAARSAQPSVVDADRLRDLRDANEQLIVAAMAAQEAGDHVIEAARREHVEFLAIVAHELRNPLAPIQTAATLLQRASIDNPLLAQLQKIISGQVGQLSRIIEDLLDGSRASTGTFRVDRHVLDLNGPIVRAIANCRPAIEARRQTLDVHLQQAGSWILGDPVRLVQVFSNLLDNASKYTRDGGEIVVRVLVLARSLQITISDNGIGIAAEVLPGIFGLFVQDNEVLPTQRRGLGIGLAVVRSLVEAHGGSIQARSAGRNLGSQFVVTLPMADAPFEPATASSADRPQSSAEA